MLIKKFKDLLIDDKGAVMALVAFGLVAILGCAALVIDAGMLYAQRAKASNAIDAAVLAGVRELPETDTPTLENPATAKDKAVEYAQANGLDPNDVTFVLGDKNADNEYTSITGDVDSDMNMFFARVLGINTGDVKAHAKARVGVAGGFGDGNGVIPIGVREDEIPPLTEESHPSFVIKEGGGDGETGWYGYVEIDGHQIKQDIVPGIVSGSENPVWIDQILDVITGVKNASEIREAIDARINGCTHIPKCGVDGYDIDCYRIVYVPVGYDDDGPGGNKTFTITGFAALLLEERTEEDKSQVIRGTFLQPIVAPNGFINDGATNFGVYAAELCE
jgi:hypothetical protein